jgi:hypothetical protein
MVPRLLAGGRRHSVFFSRAYQTGDRFERNRPTAWRVFRQATRRDSPPARLQASCVDREPEKPDDGILVPVEEKESMRDDVYDREGVRILAQALGDALRDVEARAQRRLGEKERAVFTERVARRLLDAFDIGERTLDGLRRVALSAIDGGAIAKL